MADLTPDSFMQPQQSGGLSPDAYMRSLQPASQRLPQPHQAADDATRQAAILAEIMTRPPGGAPPAPTPPEGLMSGDPNQAADQRYTLDHPLGDAGMGNLNPYPVAPLQEHPWVSGGVQMGTGAKNLVTGGGEGRLRGASDIVRGAMDVGTGAIPGAIAKAPLATVAGLGGAIGAQQISEPLLKKLGLSPGAAALSSDAIALLTGALAGGGAHKLEGAVDHYAGVGERVTEAPSNPDAFMSGLDKANAADTRVDKIAAKRARTKPEVPNTGEPEQVSRVTDARERLAQKLTGKPWNNVSDSESQAIDELITKGYGMAVEPPKETPNDSQLQHPVNQQQPQGAPGDAKSASQEQQAEPRQPPAAVVRPPAGGSSPQAPVKRGGTIGSEDVKAMAARAVAEMPAQNVTPPREPQTKPAYGNQVTVKVPGETTEYKGRYAIREASDVYPSHNPVSFAENADYEHTNERDYQDAGNASRVVHNSGPAFDPDYLTGENTTAEHGAPVIDPRGNALGGNNRTMTLKRVYELNPEGEAAYRQQLAERVAQRGIDPAELSRFKKPVLVRELNGGDDPEVAIRDFNKKGAADLGPHEQAVADGKRLSPETAAAIAGKLGEVGEDSTLAQALQGDNGGDILNRMVKDGALTEQEKNGYLDNGKLTPEAKHRIAAALVGRLFPDARTLANTPPELRNKLERVAPQALRLEGRPEWDITPQLREGLSVLEDARAHGLRNFEDLVNQPDMEGKVRSYSPEAMAVAKALRNGPNAAAGAFRRFANDEALSRPGAPATMFEAPTRAEAFRDAFEKRPVTASEGERGSFSRKPKRPDERQASLFDNPFTEELPPAIAEPKPTPEATPAAGTYRSGDRVVTTGAPEAGRAGTVRRTVQQDGDTLYVVNHDKGHGGIHRASELARETAPPSGPATPPEPWRMTSEEYLNAKGVNAGRSAIQQAHNEHSRAVYDAVAAGKPVPPEVLKEYPTAALDAPRDNSQAIRSLEAARDKTFGETQRRYQEQIDKLKARQPQPEKPAAPAGNAEKPSPEDRIAAALKQAQPGDGLVTAVGKVRALVPDLSKEEFDRAAARLFGDRRVWLHDHSAPHTLGPTDQAELVKLTRGNGEERYYGGMASRTPEGDVVTKRADKTEAVMPLNVRIAELENKGASRTAEESRELGDLREKRADIMAQRSTDRERAKAGLFAEQIPETKSADILQADEARRRGFEDLHAKHAESARGRRAEVASVVTPEQLAAMDERWSKFQGPHTPTYEATYWLERYRDTFHKNPMDLDQQAGAPWPPPGAEKWKLDPRALDAQKQVEAPPDPFKAMRDVAIEHNDKLARERAELRMQQPVSRQEQLARLRRGDANREPSMFDEDNEHQGGLFGSEKGGINANVATLGAAKFVEHDVAPAVKETAANVVEAADDLMKLVAPALRGGPLTEQAALIMRNRMAELARRSDQAAESVRAASRMFARGKYADNLDFMQRMESGQKQKTPELDAIAKVLRGMLDGRRRDVQALGTGKLQSWIQNYFPHMWKDPKRAANVFANVFGRRPLEGSKSFLKQRTVPTIADGLARGLEPVTDNPADMALLKTREMDRFIMAHQVLSDWKSAGLVKYIDAREGKAPAGWRQIADPIGTIYGPSIQQISEFPNEGLWTGLQKVANALGVKQERGFLNLGNAVGRASRGGEVKTLHGTAEDVLAHEIGHQIDFRAGSGKQFVLEYPDAQTVARLKAARATVADTKGTTPAQRKAARLELQDLAGAIADRKEFAKQLRDLADLRSQGGGHSQAYVRSREEKMAQLAEMWVGGRELFKRTAPKVYDKWAQFLDQNPKLHGLRDIEGNTEVTPLSQPYDVGGLVTKGHYYAPEGAARILNNYLSPGLRQQSGAFRVALGLNNTLNQMQLGLSAFHLGFTSADATVSRAALGFNALMRGKPLAAGRAFAETPIAAFTTALKGDKMLREWYKPGSQGGDVGKIVDGLVSGGGRAHMDDFYRTHVAENMLAALRKGNIWGAAIRAPFAGTEYLGNLIMREIVPRQKLGVFADLARFEMERLGPNATFEQTRAAMTKAWDSVENRMGQMTYDNLFWHRYAKDIAMLTTRSVGWNLGTLREIGGGLGDVVKQPINALQGKPVNLNRLSYLAGLVTVHATMAALYQYLKTGKGPEQLEDYFFPQNGEKDEQGRPQRISLPTYVKDVYHYATQPGRTLANKVSPLLNAFSEMIHNRDFYGTEIRHADDPLVSQLRDLAEYAGKQAVPFGIRNERREAGLGASPESRAEQFVGITPAPSDLNQTPAERLARELAAEHSAGDTRTKDQAARRDLKRELTRSLASKRGVPGDVAQALREGRLTRADMAASAQSARLTPLQRSFHPLPLEQALKVYEAANPAERKGLRPMLARKADTLKTMAPEQRARTLGMLRAALSNR